MASIFKRYMPAGFLLILVICINSCNTTPKSSRFVIGFSRCVGSDLWRRTMMEEMKMELSLHPDADFIYADADNNSKRQVEQVQKMLDRGIDLLIISPNEAQPLTER